MIVSRPPDNFFFSVMTNSPCTIHGWMEVDPATKQYIWKDDEPDRVLCPLLTESDICSVRKSLRSVPLL